MTESEHERNAAEMIMRDECSVDVVEIREMAEIANRLANRMNRSFILDERKVEAFQNHNKLTPQVSNPAHEE